MLTIDEEMRSMIATAVVAGGDCNDAETDHLCLCCGDGALLNCALIVGDEHAAALQEWVYGELGCGFHHGDIRRRELGLEAIGDDREQTFLDRICELDVLYRDEDELYEAFGQIPPD